MLQSSLLVEPESLLEPEQNEARFPVPLAHLGPLAQIALVVVQDSLGQCADVLLTPEPYARSRRRRCRGRSGLGERAAERPVEDGDDRVIVLGQVVEDDGVGELLLSGRARSGGLDNVEQVGSLVGDVGQLDVSFNSSRLAKKVGREE